MKRKQKLDLLRAANSFEAVRPDVRVPIWEPRADFLAETFEPATGFGPQPQSVAFGRSDGAIPVRQKRAAMGRDLAFRFGSDSKATEKLGNGPGLPEAFEAISPIICPRAEPSFF